MAMRRLNNAYLAEGICRTWWLNSPRGPTAPHPLNQPSGLFSDEGGALVALLRCTSRVARHGSDAFGICRNCSRTASSEVQRGGPLCKPRCKGFLSMRELYLALTLSAEDVAKRPNT